MHPRIRLIIAAALVFVLCRTAAAQASVIRDGNTKQFNPAVEAGGYPLPARAQDNPLPAGAQDNPLPARAQDDRLRVIIPYSLIGSLWAGQTWFSPYITWPWSVFNPFHWHRHDVTGRTVRAAQGRGLINRPAR